MLRTAIVAKPVRVPLGKVVRIILLLMPLLWTVGYLLSRGTSHPCEACQRTTAMTLSWPVGCCLVLLIDRSDNKGMSRMALLFQIRSEHLGAKRDHQDFAAIMRAGLLGMIFLTVFIGLWLHVSRWSEARKLAAWHPSKPSGPGLDPDF